MLSLIAMRATTEAANAVALTGAFAGCIAAFASWRQLRRKKRGADAATDSRHLLLSMWSMMTSLWLFGAIVFNAIGSAPGPSCPG
jgi:hypothetical protein